MNASYIKHPSIIGKTALVIGLLAVSIKGYGQCTNRIEHLSGTQTIGCTDVTVTASGGTAAGSVCNGGPYTIGVVNDGSFTFTFSTPVAGVTLSFAQMDNHDEIGFGHEEISIRINGVHYNLTDSGFPDCNSLQGVINASGNLQCPDCGDPNCIADSRNIQIDQTITSIEIRDISFINNQAGTIFSIFFCCSPCLVDAGVLESPAFNLCPGGTANVPPATLTYLPPGTLLQYVLFEDPADTLGSILATSNTPSFSFNPANMQLGKTYYIAGIAGDNTGGNVDLNSFCLDFSNAIEVIWWPKPEVAFSVDNTIVCLGQCTTVTATFSGSPPYNLTYKTNFSGPVTAIFNDDVSTFEICATGNATPGSFLLQATSLTDAHCTCN